MIEISNEILDRFAADGYCVVPALADDATVRALRDQVGAAMDDPPIELEADTGYPGAPANARAPGGNTPRRLLQAWTRGGELADWAGNPRVVEWLRRLLGSQAVWLTQAHHNCVMTKFPGFSSDTLWHQDIRYWSFTPPRLVNTWLALGEEYPENGGLKVIPGSHAWTLDPERLDEQKFLRPELPVNAGPIASARSIQLHPGDVLFFNAGLFHAASRNTTDRIKLSVVFSYHGQGVVPVPGSRSASLPDIRVDAK